MKGKTKTKTFLCCFIATLFGVYFLGSSDFKDLKYIDGFVSSVETKEKRPGAFVWLISKSNEIVVLNIDSVPKGSSELIKGIKEGEQIKAWYTKPLPMKYDSVQPWQVEYRGVNIISYDRTRKKHLFFRNTFLLLGLVFLTLSFWFFYKQKKR